MDKKTQKILVVEDEKPMARALELKLTHEGYKVKTAFNGKEALEVLKKEKFDLMILDLVMPQSDGFDVLRELKSVGKVPPTIVLSNLSQDEDIAKVTNMGAGHYFVKSNTPLSAIVQKVNEIFSE